MPVTAGALLTSVAINGGIGAACFTLFGFLKQWRPTCMLYEPKRFTGADNVTGAAPASLAAPLPRGLLGWVGAVWRYSEAEVVDLSGLDVAVFFRLLQLGVRLFLFTTCYVLLVVLPVNYSGGYLQRTKRRRPRSSGPSSSAALEAAAAAAPPGAAAWAPAGTAVAGLGNFSDAIHTNVDLFSLANVPPGSSKMWVHLLSCYLVTFVALKLLWDLSRDVAFKRAVFLAVKGRSGQGSSVLVSDVPGLEWGTPRNRLRLGWLLPAGLFRRGFDPQQQRSAVALPRRASRPDQQAGSSYEATQPLLQGQEKEGSSDEPDDSAAAAAAPAAAPAAAAAAAPPAQAPSSSIEATAAGSSGSAHAGAGRPQQPQPQPQRGRELGPPLVQEVWHEAVEALHANGGNVKALVDGEMRRVYGADSVAAVSLVHDTSALEAAASSYRRLQAQFEDVLDWYLFKLPREPEQQQQQQQQDEEAGQRSGDASSSRSSAKRKQQLLHGITRRKVLVVGPRWGAWGIERFGLRPTQVDALEFYPAVLQHQLDELQQLQRGVLRALPRPAAFVSFRGQLVATLAAASLHSYDESSWAITPAPAPQELLWPALGLRSWERALRSLLCWGAFWLLVLFYLPVVAAIQAPINIDSLSQVPVLASLLKLPLVASLVQGFVPQLVLLLFLAVLPSLLLALIACSGVRSVTEQDTALTQLYFLFQLFAVFIFSFISGTALSQLQGLIDDPHRIVSLLGISAPQQASFFMTWILLLGLSRAPLQLLRLPALAWYLLRVRLEPTPRQRRRLWAGQQELLGRVLPLHAIVLLLGLVFCVASPLIAPITLLYFTVATVVQRWQWIFVYTHAYEGAGTLWQAVFTQVLVAVYFFVAVTASLLAIKRFEQALLLLPLAAGVVVFHVLASRALQRPLTLPSSREAAAVDRFLAAHAAQEQCQRQHGGADGGDQAAAAPGGRAAAGAAAAAAAGRLAGLPDQAGGLPCLPTEDELRQLYLNPCLALGQQQLQPLLDEAADLQRRLAAAGL